MTKAREFLKSLRTKIPTDKTLHFLVSYFLMSVFYMFVPDKVYACIIITIGIGLIKEYWIDDCPDVNDFIADVCGVASFLAITLFSILLK